MGSGNESLFSEKLSSRNCWNVMSERDIMRAETRNHPPPLSLSGSRPICRKITVSVVTYQKPAGSVQAQNSNVTHATHLTCRIVTTDKKQSINQSINLSAVMRQYKYEQ